jgi:hypothetical protein
MSEIITGALFGPVCEVASTAPLLARAHYLGPCKRGRFAWSDRSGVMVFGSPASRRLPTNWLELTRWCLTGGKNAGSRQWSAFVRWARSAIEETTIVSYSDPSAGHDGALYRACGWLWAPTWHRLREPPTGLGSWTDGKRQAAKDRWIFPLNQVAGREIALKLNDESLLRRMPWAEYREPRWRRGKPQLDTGGGNRRRWREHLRTSED